jgi:putative transposase
MTRRASKAQPAQPAQGLFVEQGALAAMIEACVRQVLEEELTRHIGAGPYERTEGRRGQRNGNKPRTMRTAVGRLHFDVPQVRQGGWRPSVFERYQRSDRALVAALQEMVVQGVSTRRVSAVLEEMAGFEVSAATVSRAMAELDEEIARWRSRRLDERQYPYLIIDARYEKVRVAGRVRSQTVLMAAGITDEGRRELLGFWTGDSESEATWSEVFMDLKRRGLEGVELVVSDAHGGIRAALARQMQGAAWQRCRVHLMREMMAKVQWRDYKELAADLRAIFVSENAGRCLEVAGEVADKWERRAPRMAAALRAGIEDCLVAKSLGPRLWRRLGSTNMLERLMREIKRRTRVVGAFPNVAALERLVGALAIETDEAWACEPARYLALDRENRIEEN